ncbi:Detected protein of unknown function [Hibiscus syriacus]|uniref:Transcription repressor n=1 Tax=Hibiscus syriacus TaxID=106335 RepID=A0A6A2YYL5_HIBSY|nr:transcription repressor OFP8-like [Hibiscus syriacus]KAE8684483.1 Detected protein of unknown function [Hibiscus syriacus]
MATVSSTDSGCFSSELGGEDEETETLISNSRSFSDGSSFELDQSLAEEDSPVEIKRNKKKVNGKKMKRLRSFGSKKYKGSLAEKNSMERFYSEKDDDDTAVQGGAEEKKSEDPYKDFKRSMLEMIMEKQMFEARDFVIWRGSIKLSLKCM